MQVLLDVFLKRWQAEGAAEGDDAFDARIAMHRAVETDGALDFRNEIGEDRPHGLEDLPLVFAGGGVAFEFFGLGEIELETLGEGFGEIIPADGDGAEPYGFTIGDDEVGVFGTAVDDHRRAIVQSLVILHAVVDGQGAHLHDLHVHFHIGELLNVGVHQFFAHREDADFHIRRLRILEKLVAPLDIFQREGNLLNGFEFDDFGDFLRFDRGQFDEAREARLPADADADDAALGRMPLGKTGESRLNQALFVIPGGGENLLVFDDFNIIDPKAISLANEFDGFEGAVADIDSPCRAGGGHLLTPLVLGAGSSVVWCNVNGDSVQLMKTFATRMIPSIALRYFQFIRRTVRSKVRGIATFIAVLLTAGRPVSPTCELFRLPHSVARSISTKAIRLRRCFVPAGWSRSKKAVTSGW